MPTITLNEGEAFDLLIILQGYTETKSREIAQALEDEEAGKRTDLFNDYVDFIAALSAQRSKAQKLLRDVQQQTSVIILNEVGIERL